MKQINNSPKKIDYSYIYFPKLLFVIEHGCSVSLKNLIDDGYFSGADFIFVETDEGKKLMTLLEFVCECNEEEMGKILYLSFFNEVAKKISAMRCAYETEICSQFGEALPNHILILERENSEFKEAGILWLLGSGLRKWFLEDAPGCSNLISETEEIAGIFSAELYYQ